MHARTLMQSLPSNTATVAVLLIFIAVVAAVLNALRRRPPPETPLYSLQPSILTAAERSFAGVLELLLPPDVRLVVKIRLADVFAPRQGLTRSVATSALNRISAKHVDFLLIRVSDAAPLVGIELDDKSHEAGSRIRRDMFVDDVFQSCGLPLLHVVAKSSYNANELRSQVAHALRNSTRQA